MTDNPISKQYKVNNDISPILLKVFIGFGQTSIMVDSNGNQIFGSSAVYIDNQLWRIGIINNLPLGTASQLKNKIVTILTTVLDIGV
jgi:hypothetical protein